MAEDDILSRADEVRAFILDHVDGHPSDIASVAADHFDVTRQAIHNHLQALEADGLIVSEGRTRAKTYRRPDTNFDFPTKGLQEHDVYLEYVKPLLQDLPENVLSICAFGITEMVNNVIDHSGSHSVHVQVRRTPKMITLIVADTGIGIFRKIQQECQLEDPRLAIFELTKGKLTTDPEHHTGEGVFFTSRLFDRFSILSRELFLGHRRDGDDWLLKDPEGEQDSQVIGTWISMKVDPQSTHTVTEVLDKYTAEEDDYAFSKTHVVVMMAQTGDASFISRSQAKRIVARLEKFREAVLDFEGVDEIAPAFADEIFRVFASQYPNTHLEPINMNEQVTKMVRRVTSAAGLTWLPQLPDQPPKGA